MSGTSSVWKRHVWPATGSRVVTAASLGQSQKPAMPTTSPVSASTWLGASASSETPRAGGGHDVGDAVGVARLPLQHGREPALVAGRGGARGAGRVQLGRSRAGPVRGQHHRGDDGRRRDRCPPRSGRRAGGAGGAAASPRPTPQPDPREVAAPPAAAPRRTPAAAGPPPRARGCRSPRPAPPSVSSPLCAAPPSQTPLRRWSVTGPPLWLRCACAAPAAYGKGWGQA